MPCKYSTVPAFFSPTAIARFWSKVEKTPTCWLWKGTLHSAGYGHFQTNGCRYFAHRASYVIAHGPIPPGLSVLHHCDTPDCIRPDHLFLGTQTENMRDMLDKGRHVVQQRTKVWPRGDEHWARQHPEWVRRGDRHHARMRPETMARGERCGAARMTAEQVRAIRHEYRSGKGYTVLGREYGLSKSGIAAIIRRESWAHIDD